MAGDNLSGTWLLRSHRIEDVATGERSMPFGAAPVGVLVAGADGRLTALIMPGAAADDSNATPASMIAYSGRYRVLPPDRIVTTVDIAWLAPWLGSEQVRRFTVVGDRLEIATEPQPMPGAEGLRIAVMSWERERVA